MIQVERLRDEHVKDLIADPRRPEPNPLETLAPFGRFALWAFLHKGHTIAVLDAVWTYAGSIFLGLQVGLDADPHLEALGREITKFIGAVQDEFQDLRGWDRIDALAVEGSWWAQTLCAAGFEPWPQPAVEMIDGRKYRSFRRLRVSVH